MVNPQTKDIWTGKPVQSSQKIIVNDVRTYYSWKVKDRFGITLDITLKCNTF